LFFQYIMDSSQKNNIQGMTQFYQQAASDSLPSVSFVRPDATNDGHPASSTPALLQNFVQNVVEHVQANKKLWYSSAITFTVDSTGGYYQPGHNQALTYFGDGGSIPFLMISPYVTPGTVHHTYADTDSMDKLVESNWKLPPIAADTVDNLPNPLPNPSNPYLPPNEPAISDLSGYFTQSSVGGGTAAVATADAGHSARHLSDSGSLAATSPGWQGSELGAPSPSQDLAGSVIGAARSLSQKDLRALSVVGA
ncbi:MAG: alkaline phosphatase family protein, partial [Methylacidiphilaceae bacterium]|nr:alkaline phosphatase family protein [Candidatus Methylacidiphilaceae bacterium]